MTDFVDATGFGLPISMEPFTVKGAHCSLQIWLIEGPRLVNSGVDYVQITDAHPCEVNDLLSSGCWGWVHYCDWRLCPWLIPEVINYFLPRCPYKCVEDERDGGACIMKRWTSIKDAMNALNLAAYAWAEAEALKLS